MKFQVIVADCPWSFKDSLKMSDVKRGAQANYNTMTIQQIKDIQVKDIASDGAILALWVPSSLLQEGLDVMNAWGFKHKQTYVWVKVKKLEKIRKSFFKDILAICDDLNIGVSKRKAFSNFTINLFAALGFGMGHLFRQTHEICLIGINSNKIYKLLKNRSQRSVDFAENLKHSAKPEELQDALELMFPNTDKIELFARRLRPGWTCLGNEVCNGEDINISLSKIL